MEIGKFKTLSTGNKLIVLEKMEKNYEENYTLNGEEDVEFVLDLIDEYDMELCDYVGDMSNDNCENEICDGDIVLISRSCYYMDVILEDLIEKIKG